MGPAACEDTVGATGAGLIDDCEQPGPGSPGPAPNSYFIGPDGQGGCGWGTSDGNGTLALTMGFNHDSTKISFVSGSGALLTVAETALPEAFMPQRDGFDAIVRVSAWYGFTAWSSAGDPLPNTPQMSQPYLLAEDPLGGFVVVTAQLTSYDAQLNMRWQLAAPGTVWVLAVDRAGRTLVLFDGSARFGQNSVAAEWIDRCGAGGPIFRFLGPQPKSLQAMPFGLVQRVGSGLFLFQTPNTGDGLQHVQWMGEIDSLATALSAAPAWLEARPDTRLHMAYGGGAYAVLPLPRDSTECAQSIEVVAPGGASCGMASFTAGSGECSMKGIMVGYDGTVIQQMPSSLEQQCWFGPCTCTWRWWPAFFGSRAR